jgi:hypothetical protein
MADFENTPRFKPGDRVRALFGGRLVGWVKRVTPARTPTAHTLYTVHVPMDPEPLLLLVRESEIEKVDELGSAPVSP